MPYEQPFPCLRQHLRFASGAHMSIRVVEVITGQLRLKRLYDLYQAEMAGSTDFWEAAMRLLYSCSSTMMPRSSPGYRRTARTGNCRQSSLWLGRRFVGRPSDRQYLAVISRF